ncbi:trichohyalin-like isoform X2 [Tripterygium wilfordii]|uniref:trichohyalin-like isoform X2 n=1 Tax=Tripterygium wilfordii TaxID=458696 RepID=UPI0018F85925|nr:trichohyalin-like isoform X2 [Tripterygium wilfordii]
MDPIKGLEDSMDIEALLKFYDDGQSAAETLAIKQLAGTGETEHPISQHQATHDQATRPSSKKRGEQTPLDKEEQRRRKQIADKKSRAKKKANSNKKEEELQASKRKVKELESEKALWNEERNSMAQKIGRLKSKNKRLKEDADGKIVEELRGLKTEVYKLKGVNASMIVEGDMTKKNLQREDTYTKQLELKTRVDTYNSNEANRGQQELVNMFLHMEQEQLGQEKNGRLGRPIATSRIPSMQVEKWNREVEEARNDRAEGKKQMNEFLEEMRAEGKRQMDEFLEQMRAENARLMSEYMMINSS